MSFSGNNTTVNPTNLDSLTGSFKEILKKERQNTDGMIPAIVMSYNRSTNRVNVRPAITLIDQQNRTIPRNPILNLPVDQPGGGGFIINFPLKIGDLGYIIAGDRDPTNYLINGQQARPASEIFKQFAFGVFRPAPLNNYTISSGDQENLVIQSIDGSTKLTLSQNTITINAQNINIISVGNTTLNAASLIASISGSASITAGAVTVNSGGETTISSTGNVSMVTPVLAVTGNITATGTITPGVV